MKQFRFTCAFEVTAEGKDLQDAIMWVKDSLSTLYLPPWWFEKVEEITE